MWPARTDTTALVSCPRHLRQRRAVLREGEAELRRRSVPVYAAVCDVGNREALSAFIFVDPIRPAE